MIRSWKLQTSSQAALLFAGGVAISLLGMTSLYAGSQVTWARDYAGTCQSAIQRYELAGDFAKALTLANESVKELKNLGLAEEAKLFSEMAGRLEDEWLKFGALRLFFDENFQPKVKLLNLLELAGMDSLEGKEDAALQINDWAQKNLLRQGERWQEQTSKFEELKPKIQPLLIELGVIEGTHAHFDEYEGSIVLGATLPAVRLRIHHLVEQWKRGVRFSNIYFLSAERSLDAERESRSALLDAGSSPLKVRPDWVPPVELPSLECHMMQMVWEQSEIPQEMREHVSVHLVFAPMKNDPIHGKLIRSTTDDTVKAWVALNPPSGRYLAVSNAPYTMRQDLVLKSMAPCEYGFDTIGPAVSEQVKMAIVLDEIARLIYQAKQASIKK